jgi:hypothetical protein
MVFLLAGCAGSQPVGPVMEPTPVALPETAPMAAPAVDTDTIYFGSDSAALDDDAREVLATLGLWMERSPAHRIELLVGDAPLEQQRAETARQFMIDMGFEPGRVTLVRTPPPEPTPGLHTLEIEQRDTFVELTVEPEPSVPIERSFSINQTPEQPPGLLRDLGVGLSAGVGFVTFLDDGATAVTEPGAGWDVRLALGTRKPVALEAAYVGSVQEIDALGLDSDAVLVSNGAEANLRIALTRDRPLTPYLLAGVGWARYSIANTEVNTSNLADDDDVIQVPVGVGVSFTSGPVLVDVRTLIRSTLDEQLMAPTADGEEVDLHSWSLAIRAGWQL